MNNANVSSRQYRPRFHFTPKKGWINDPNGLLYINGVYHLFAQHYPDGTEWGPMHWAHAVSKDLMRWEELPIALYPDDLGLIFSGSAVYDVNNTSGFGTKEQPPIVCMFTHHFGPLEHKLQRQSIAYSLDGIHFIKYAGNPVIDNPGISDFRDPKIIWNDILNCWTALITAGDHIQFYASPDLKQWNLTGTFGKVDNHAEGVFECPDLLRMIAPDGSVVWVLIISMGISKSYTGCSTGYNNSFVFKRHWIFHHLISNRVIHL